MSIWGSTQGPGNEGVGNQPPDGGEAVPSKTSEVSRKRFSQEGEATPSPLTEKHVRRELTESDESTEEVLAPSRSLLTRLEVRTGRNRDDPFGVSLARDIGTDAILRHREILSEIQQKTINQEDNRRESLVARVYALSDPHSHSVVHVDDDISTFSIPGKPGILYEVRLVKDRYFFIVHNSGIEDIDTENYKRLHGNVRVIDERGAQCGKTSVSIEVPKDALTWQFFDELVETGYGAIVKHLLDSRKGVIQVSDEEKKAQEYLGQKHAKSPVGLLEKEIQHKTRTIETLKMIQDEASNEVQPLIDELSEQVQADEEYLKTLQTIHGPTVATASELRKYRIWITKDASIGTLQLEDTYAECSRKGPEVLLAPEDKRRELEIHSLRTLMYFADLDLRILAGDRIQTLLSQPLEDTHLEGKKRSRAEAMPQGEKPKKLARKEVDEEIEVEYNRQPREEPLLSRVVSYVANSVFTLSNSLSTTFLNMPLYIPRTIRPIGTDQGVTNVAKLFVNFTLKKYVESPIGKSRQDELHERFDGTAGDLIAHKLRYAERFQDNFQHLLDDPEGLDRIVRHREISVEIHRQDVKALVRRVDALSSASSPQVVHLANGGACFSFISGCKGHSVTYEIRYEYDEYYLVIHNRGFGGDDPDLHGRLAIKAANGVTYAKASVPIMVPKEKLTKELFTVLLEARTDETMDRAYGYIKEHLLEPDGANIERSNEEIEATKLYLQKKTMRDEVIRIAKVLTSKFDLLQRLQELPQESFVKKLDFSTRERLLEELQTLQELVRNPEFPLFTQGEQEQILSLMEPSKEVVDLLKAVVKRSTGYLLESELPNAILETDETFSSDQIYGTCTESSKTGPEKQMASSNTRRLLKLYTIQELAETVRHSEVPTPTDKRDLLQLGELRQTHLWSKVTIKT